MAGLRGEVSDLPEADNDNVLCEIAANGKSLEKWPPSASKPD